MNNQEKRKIFEQHLREQEQQRQLQLQRRRQAESQQLNPQENMLYIQKEFRTLMTQMDSLIASAKKGEAQIAQLVNQQAVIKEYYLQVNYALTTFDRQTYKEVLEKNQTQIQELKLKLQPKKKFKFSRRDEDFGVKEVQQAAKVKGADRKETTIPGIENKKDESIKVQNWEGLGGSFKIIDCSNCEIELLDKTQILFLKGLRGCKIKAAVTRSTVFVEDCVDCSFELNCHQLRIHKTHKTNFSIFVTSKAIIEDCTGVVFGPYNWQYPSRQQHESEQDRLGKPNLWRDIQDFNWLKQNEQSPHFSLVQE